MTTTLLAPIAVQLLERRDRAEPYLTDNRVVAQPKYDGMRLLLCKQDRDCWGQNRTGGRVGLGQPLRTALQSVAGSHDIVLDGELVEGVFWAFDLLIEDERDWRSEPYAHRLVQLQQVVAVRDPILQLAITACDTPTKTALYEGLKRMRMEGIVFKDVRMSYQPGRHASQVKVKFVETAVVRVLAHNQKRSVQIAVQERHVGDVAIPSNAVRVPPIGTLLEVRYQHCFKDSGKLFSPVYVRERTDVAEPDAFGSLKFKATFTQE
jgi:bifunctional non-homologous end joining protein LigD